MKSDFIRRTLRCIVSWLMIFAMTLPYTQVGYAYQDKNRSIDPADGTNVYTFYFYKTKDDADKAKNNASPAPTPIEVQRIKYNGKLIEPQLVEKKDMLFEGWYYMDGTEEKKLTFGESMYVDASKEYFAYPKYSEVHAVYFVDQNIVLKAVRTKDDHLVSMQDQPNVMRENKRLTGWSIEDPNMTTRAQAEAAGKLFHFKEDPNPTVVNGSMMIYAIMEDSIHITFDTHGGDAVQGQYLSKDETTVEVPTVKEDGNTRPVQRTGYELEYWYIAKKEKDPTSGQMIEKEIPLTTKTENGKEVFDYPFTTSTVVHAKWKGLDVPFTVIFMREKRYASTFPEDERYEYVGSFQNIPGRSDYDANFVTSQGKAGSVVELDSTEGNVYKVTNWASAKLADPMKYETKLGVPQDYMKGFHLNKAKTNEWKGALKGDGTSAKIVYYDRDMVYVDIRDASNNLLGTGKPGDSLYDEKLYGFKFGERPDGKIWEYFITGPSKARPGESYMNNRIPQINVANSSKMYSNAPAFVEYMDSMKIMEKDGDYWKFPIKRYSKPVGSQVLVGAPIYVPKGINNVIDAHMWVQNAPEAEVKARVLPKTGNGIFKLPGISAATSMGSEDFTNMEGFTKANFIPKSGYYGTRSGSSDSGPTYKVAHNRISRWLGDQDGKIYNPDLTSANTGTKYYTFPIYYTRNEWKMTFLPQAQGMSREDVLNIPYDARIIGAKTEYEKNPQEANVQAVLEKYVKATFDPETKEINNMDKVTKNNKGEVFMGWFLDPAFTQPFVPEKYTMPDRNVSLFGKWEPVYHYVKIHHYPKFSSNVNNPEYITEIKVAHEGKVSSTDPNLTYVVPAGYTANDFQGWETYGDIAQQKPSADGTGGAFPYDFDRPVTGSVHLYPNYTKKKARVAYLFNYDDNEQQPITEDEFQQLQAKLQQDGSWMLQDRIYLSQYQYNLDSPLRLRAPLGFDSENLVNEPKAPEGTKAYGKRFIGWRIETRDYLDKTWASQTNERYYYNSYFNITRNTLTYATNASDNESMGVLVFVAVWGEPTTTTSITLHSNYAPDATKTIDGIVQNEKFQLPSIGELAEENPAFKREGYQFDSWNSRPDGKGIKYKNAQEILADDQFAAKANHLYAQWTKLYVIDAEKTWEGMDAADAPKVGIGLMRRVTVGPADNPSFQDTSGFKAVKGSVKYLPDDAVNGKLTWNVDGFNDKGERYAYITVEVKPGDEQKFYNAKTFEELNVHINQETRQKTQYITLGNNDPIDAFTSATVRSTKENKVDAEGNPINGYDFKITNTKQAVQVPEIAQPYDGDTSVLITPKDDNAKIIVKLPGDKTVTLTKGDDGSWTSNDPSYPVTKGEDGKLTVKLPDGTTLHKDEKVSVQGVNKEGTLSQKDEKTVLARPDSPVAEKPQQGVRTDDNKVVITSKVPTDPKPAPGTTYTLTDADGNPIMVDGKPITATPDANGNLRYEVPDGILKDGQQVKVKVEEPGKNPTLSELSEPLDLTAPVITAGDVTAKVGVPLQDGAYVVEVSDKTMDGLILEKPDNKPLPADFTLQKGTDSTDKLQWKVTGAGRYVITEADNYTVTYTAVDKFGNVATKVVKFIVTEKDVTGVPVIDQPHQGDTTVTVTPPADADHMIVTAPDGTTTELTKTPEGKWTDGTNTYEPKEGKVTVPVPGGKPLNDREIVKVTAEDRANHKEPSGAEKVVQPSTQTLPPPTLYPVKVGDKTFGIKPNANGDGTIPDKMTLSIQHGGTSTLINLVWDKTQNAWIEKDGDTVKGTYKPDKDGKIMVNVPEGITLTVKDSIAATEENTALGISASVPTSINIDAEQSKVPTGEQGKTTNDGNPTITGKGVPGADITVKDDKGNVIAGPVKVDKDGNYTVEVPKGSVPADGNVTVIQKEDGKPESEPRKVTIDNKAPAKPVLDQPAKDATEVKVTPPADPDTKTVVVTFPGGKTVELTKDENGNWTTPDGTTVKKDGDKLIVPTPDGTPLKNGDTVTAVAKDGFGNTSEPDSKTVNAQPSAKPEPPEQQPNTADGSTPFKGKVPAGADPKTKYTLTDGDGNPIKDKNGNPITGTVNPEGTIDFVVPPGIVKEGDKVTITAEEPGKTPTTSDPTTVTFGTLDAPKIDQPNVGDKTAKVTPPEGSDKLIVTLPDGTTKTYTKKDGKWMDGDQEAKVTDGKIEVPVPALQNGDVIKAKAEDSTGTKKPSPEAMVVVKSSKMKTPTPEFAKVTAGDETFKIKPIDQPTDNIYADKIVVTFQGADGREKARVTLTKKDDGSWSDGKNTYQKGEDGFLTVNVPEAAQPLTSDDSLGATAEDVARGHQISDPTSIKVNAAKSATPTGTQVPSKNPDTVTITGKGQPNADITIYDKDGNKIAGPVKTDEKGNYTVDVPKNSITKDEHGNDIVQVGQKEDGKPDSDKTPVTVDKTAPAKPVIDQPTKDATSVKVTPPADADTKTIVVTFPGNKTVELTKDGDTWKLPDGTPVTKDGDKLVVPTPDGTPLKNGDTVTAVAKDGFGNTSEPDSKTVNADASIKPDPPVQQPKNPDGSVPFKGKVPNGASPDTKYTLVDGEGNPLRDKAGKPIEVPGKVNPDGSIDFVVPDGVVSDGTVVKIKAEEPGKTPVLSDPTVVDFTAPGKPTLDQPNAGETSVKVTPPSDPDTKTIVVTFPGDKTVIVTKDGDTWKLPDGTPVTKDGDKLIVPIPDNTPLKDKDTVTVIAKDDKGNTSEPDKKTVTTDDIIPVPDPNNPPAKPEGYITVTFAADKSYGAIATNQTFMYYVRSGSTLPKDKAPQVEAKQGYQVNPNKPWDKDQPWTFTEDTTINAQFVADSGTQTPPDIIPTTPGDKDNDNPNVPGQRATHVLVEFLPGDHGTLEGTTMYWVKIGTDSRLIDKPTIKAANGYEVANPAWDKSLPATITEAVKLTAQYSPVYDDIIPVPDPTNPPAKPEGYITVTFAADKNYGKIKEGDTYTYFVKPGSTLDKAPEVTPNDGYHVNQKMPWDKPIPFVVPVDQKTDITINAQFVADSGTQTPPDIIPTTPGDKDNDNPNPNDPGQPATHVLVEFLPGEHGTLDGITMFWVKIGTTKHDLEPHIPSIKPNNGWKVKADPWSPVIPNTITESHTFTAQYEKVSEPVNPPTPTPTPEQPVKPTPDQPDRINGPDRIATSIEVSKQKFGQAKTVIVARYDVFADALVAGPLAYALDAPILLTDPHYLPEKVAQEIARLGAQHIIIVGGKQSVDENVENSLRQFDRDPERLAGANRYITSVRVAERLKRVNGGRSTAIIATGETYPDALTVGPYAAREGMPILLVMRYQIEKEVAQAFKTLGISRVEIAGGHSSVSAEIEKQMPKVIERYQGPTRYETAVDIAKKTNPNAQVIYIASGEVFADALVAGPAAAKENAPILLTQRNEAPRVLKDYMKQIGKKKIVVIGGRHTITDASIESLLP